MLELHAKKKKKKDVFFSSCTLAVQLCPFVSRDKNGR